MTLRHGFSTNVLSASTGGEGPASQARRRRISWLMDATLQNGSLLALRQRKALLSIAGFWTFYGLIATVRSAVIGQPHAWALLGGRVIVILISMTVSYGIYSLVKRIPTRSLAHGVLAVAVLALPSAIIYTVVNNAVFDTVSALSPPMVQVWAPVVPDSATKLSATKMTVDSAINSYFFFSAWGALYLALCYAAEVGALERRNAHFRAAAQAAELRALRYQINPHFLFNTLNALSSLVMAGQHEGAERMILSLSRFFRTSLNDDPTRDVRLGEEIRLQRLYLEIEQVRFADRLRVDIDVPEALEDVCVPGLILQPLVENAVKHGVSKSRRPVTIRVRAVATAADLRLTVEDDGEGADEGAPSEGAGVGLRNVRDRLAARYGDAATCLWEAPPDGGFRVSISLPLVRDDD